MNHRILITGSSGLVGSALARELEGRGADVLGFDLRERGGARGDIRQCAEVAAAVADVSGVVHLAAVSRVLWGERDPEGCWSTNVDGTRNVLDAAAKSPRKPWVISASSREVYGQPAVLPASEDTPLRPVNIYGRSKVEGERLVEQARRAGVRACTVRFSNVFGATTDHADRVVPAFARAAVAGGELRVDGADHTFDFTFIGDVARGVASLVDLLATGAAPPPPIHFVSGRPTTLAELAALAIQLAGTTATIAHASPRDFDVARFVGDGARARRLLDWQPRVALREGLHQLIRALRDQHEPAGPAARWEGGR
ncbi:MAG: NAD(P)-dependent oxidoreductase [Polyangiaceae bacterium]|nr:NAD(P)-dependent oxidoreductase [Polyangiaceae bacterium]